MLKPEEMSRVSIIGSKSVMKETVDTLHNMKILHIEDFYREKEKTLADKFNLQIGSPLKEAEDIAASLIRMRSLQSRLPAVPQAAAWAQSREVTQKNIASLEASILSLSEALKAVEDERARILAQEKELEVFEEMPVHFERLADYKSLSVLAGYVSKKSSAQTVQNALWNAAPRSQAYFWQYAGRPVVLIFVESRKKDDVLKMLAGFGFAEINIANVKALNGSAKDNLRGLQNRERELDREKARINTELAAISRQWFSQLQVKEKELSSASERAEAPLRFATTASTFVAEGWVPCRTYNAMVRQLDLATRSKVYVEQHPDPENAPVELKNPKPVEPFEFFMNLYSLPRYTEIDPTFFMFLTFPLFFGMMLGDIGYGIITTALFLFLRRKFNSPDMRALFNVLVFASVASIIFGFVFGEFFGEEAIFGTELPRLLNRVEGMQEMILITAGIGIVHLNIGFLLGFINKFKEHGFIHALLEKGAWFVVEAGVALIAADYLKYVSIGPYVGGAVFLAGLLMLLKGEGIKGVVELPALLSNTLSYTRIMAVGLASASLALVVNEFAGEFFHMGGIYMLIAVIILVLGHAVNLALGILGPFLHSLRLHYVEFFTKFFEGGGKRYAPFGR